MTTPNDERFIEQVINHEVDANPDLDGDDE